MTNNQACHSWKSLLRRRSEQGSLQGMVALAQLAPQAREETRDEFLNETLLYRFLR